MNLQIYHVILAYVTVGTFLPIACHSVIHQFSWIQASLAFFLVLNALICLWEISLGINIVHIKNHLKTLNENYGTNRLTAVVDLFLKPVTVQEVFTLKTWGDIWSTYGMYDPSYANQESFGFFVDVGNGWTTIIPSLLFLIGMTKHDLFPSSQLMGIMGIIKFYQELYGTCIYFLSFFFNGRHKGKSLFEIGLFVGFSNGLWFVFPILGMYVSYQMIVTNGYEMFK